jgi:Winged helix DNA-binding domain
VADVLTTQALNRATLARQMLLAREKTTVLRAVERLCGMQAQLARPPYIGLWSRVAGFEASDLTRLVHARKVVRGTLMRITLHLVSTRDYLGLRPLLQPMLSAGFQRSRVPGLEIDPVIEAARACLEERPCTFEEVRNVLSRKWPKAAGGRAGPLPGPLPPALAAAQNRTRVRMVASTSRRAFRAMRLLSASTSMTT